MRPSGVAAPLFVSLPATISSKLILKFSTMLSIRRKNNKTNDICRKKFVSNFDINLDG
jgi:hypothetical protein